MTPLAEILAADARLAEEARADTYNVSGTALRAKALAARLDTYREALEIATEFVGATVCDCEYHPSELGCAALRARAALAEIAAKLEGKP